MLEPRLVKVLLEHGEEHVELLRPGGVVAGANVARSHKVTFKQSGITIDVGEDEYILEVAEDAGLHLPYDCRSGTCTTCIQKCLEGEIDQDMAFAIGDEELEQGLRLICIGSPLSDVVLDA